MSNIDVLENDHAGLLSDAALSELQLRQQPFADAASAGDAFADQTTADQLRDIKEALIAGDDLLLVTGPTGSGKTTLLSQLAANSGSRIQCFSVKGSERFSTQNLVAGMLEAFKRTPPDDLMLILDELIPCLQAMMSRNMLSAIVIDDADHIPEPELTKLLSSMLYINSRDETLMRIALAAEAAFEDRIPELLPDGADLPYASLAIDPMDDDRAGRYLEFRLNQAGYFDEFPFSEKELTAINESAGGIPQALHAVAADELNQEQGYGELPPELRTETTKRFGGLSSKMLLGLVACGLILGGLFLFKPPTDKSRTERYTVIDSQKIDTDKKAEELRLLKEQQEAEELAKKQAALAEAEAASQAEEADAANQLAQADTSTDEAAAAKAAEEAAAAKAAEEAAAAKAAEEAAAAKAAEEAAAAKAAEEAAAAKAAEEAAAAKAAEEAAAAKAAEEAAAQNESAPQTPTIDVGGSPLESANWVLVQNPGQFTVQMSAATDRQSVEQFLKRNPLEAPNSIFSFNRNGTTWYALVHGLYPSIAAAREAVEKMPESARSNQPWIRAVGRIQKALKDQN